MASKPSNETLLEQLKLGLAEFEFIYPPLLSISNSPQFFQNPTHRFFARIGPSLGEGSPAMKKLEHYSVQKVTGDGRCLFRALVKGMSLNKGVTLDPREERENADELRMAIKEVLCVNENERFQFEEALIAITVDESLKRYCQRIGRPDFWGGESELLYHEVSKSRVAFGEAPLGMSFYEDGEVLSKLCCQPITVYIPEHEHARGGLGSGFIPIAEYGTEFSKGSRKGKKPRKGVRLLYSGKSHYDLLV